MKTTATKTTICESTCKQWGDYNPHTYIIIAGPRKTERYEIELGHGTNRRAIGDTDCIDIVTTRRGANLTQAAIKHPRTGKIIKINEYLLKQKGITYHYSIRYGIKSTAAAYKLLQDKIAKKQAAKSERIKRDNKLGKVYSVGSIASKLGWCGDGVSDALDWLRLGRRIRKDDVLKAWKDSSSTTKSYLKDCYMSEIAQALNFCRH